MYQKNIFTPKGGIPLNFKKDETIFVEEWFQISDLHIPQNPTKPCQQDMRRL